jgi:hypothetical protein
MESAVECHSTLSWKVLTLFVRLFVSMGVRVLQPNWLIVPPALDIPTLATRCPCAYRRVPHSSGGSWNFWTGNRTSKFCLNAYFRGTFRDLLHAANLRHGNNGFTSLPKEGMLRIFTPLKIRRLRPGLNLRTWVPEASTLTARPPKPLKCSPSC